MGWIRKFRPDTYHRLSTFVIEIPPLRERRDDIPPLLEYYIQYYAEQMGKVISTIETELIERMTAYDFPGNVRELRNMVERAIILCDSKTIGWDNFRFNVPGLEESGESTTDSRPRFRTSKCGSSTRVGIGASTSYTWGVTEIPAPTTASTPRRASWPGSRRSIRSSMESRSLP